MSHGRHSRMTLAQAIEHADEVASTAECPDCAADHAQLAVWLRMIVAARTSSMRDRERRLATEPNAEPVERRASAREFSAPPDEALDPTTELTLRRCACGKKEIPLGEWHVADREAPAGNQIHRPAPLACDYRCATCGSINPLRHFPHEGTP